MKNKSRSSRRQPATRPALRVPRSAFRTATGPSGPDSAPRLRRELNARIFRIHELLAAGRYPNVHTIATQFATSTKTIRRDFHCLRDHLGAPLTYDRQRHGYCYSDPTFTLPGAPSVTEAELFALLVADQAIAQYRNTPFHQPLKFAFQKFTGQLNTRDPFTTDPLQALVSFRPLAPEDANLELFQTVTCALQQRRALRFRYRKPGEKQARLRCVHPYHLTCGENRWYLLAFDPDAAGVRTFALGRMNAAVATDQRFQRPASFNPIEYLGASFGVMKGDGDYEVVIEFDAWATDQLRGRQWHPTQTVAELPGGGSHLRMRLSGLEEVERWILSWGTHANVLQPAPLAIRLREIAAKLVERYLAVQLPDSAAVTATNGLTLNL